MPAGTPSASLAKLLALMLAAGCRGPISAEPQPSPRPVSSGSLLPRPAGAFSCGPEACVQRHPRLPDTGEWLCADSHGVVWCAGGDGAAGVVAGPADPGYRCGPRWGTGFGQRVCIDRQPDCPAEAGDYSCRFEQERGVSRVCRLEPQAPGSKPLAAGALPACFVDQDCPSKRCDRGSCRCASNADCTLGSCSDGSCVGARP